MCGRYTHLYTWRELFHLLNLNTETPEINLHQSWNVAPTQLAPIVRQEDGVRTASLVRWGLIPSWAKEIGTPLNNARSEEAATKPSFRGPFKHRRCLVPVSSFYEWEKRPEGKQPWSIRVKGVPLFCLAGLWDGNDKIGEPVESFTILTRAPNALMATIHDRMPCIVRPEMYDLWLDPANKTPESLAPVLHPFSPEEMEAHRVSTRVNSSRVNDSQLSEPASAVPPGLFG
ncbi:MAG TPA: SOS response-associated peptidase [Phycisphaerales bacterium]|nr:SOS response-associated peptidase [Phycisphaerales bacterium]